MLEGKSDSRKTFKYKRLPIRIVGMCVYVLIAVSGSIMFIYNGPVYMRANIAGIFVWSGLWFFLIGQGIILLIGGASDIVVDENGIYRELYGYRWKTLYWSNISHIKSFKIYSRRLHAFITAYNLFPIVKPKFRLFPSGKMWFNDTMEDAKSLLDEINMYATKRKIKLLVNEDGKMVEVSRFDARKI